ncbi:MAG: class I lanthipeptide [Spirosomataceae bacterium]
MKKQITKLSLKTDKIVALSSAQMSNVQGGSGTYTCKPNLGLASSVTPTTSRTC